MIRRFPLLGIFWVLLTASWAIAQEPVPIGPGVTYRNVYRSEGPWAIHIVEADLSQQYLELRSLMGGGATLARKSLTGIAGGANSDTARVVAAVNADFFSLASSSGLMLGLHVQDGELVTFPDSSRSTCYQLADGTLHLERLRANAWVRGPEGVLLRITGMNHRPQYADIVLFTPRFGPTAKSEAEATFFTLENLSGRLRPNTNVTAKIAAISICQAAPIPQEGVVLAARGVMAYAMKKLKVGDELTLSLNLEKEQGQIEQAVSGGPRLVRNGAISVEYAQERFAESFASRRHPRTGVGLRNGTIVFAVVDGRQPGYSEGMTLKEFAQLFLDLGCSDAMNLDGGGSSTVVVRNKVMNAPSGGVQRAVVNALAIVSVAPLGPPIQLSLEPQDFRVLSGEQMALTPVGLDQYYNPVPVAADKVTWETTSTLGTLTPRGVFTGAQVSTSTVGLVMAKLDTMTASAVARVLPGPAKVVVTPAKISLAPGGVQRFTAQAYDEEGLPLFVTPDRIKWRIEPTSGGAKIDKTGRLQAPAKVGHVAVLASVGEVTGQADVVVGTEQTVVENFEKSKTWNYRAEPASLPGSVAWVDDKLRDGNHCLRLQYDFSKTGGTRTAGVELNLPLPEASSFSVYVLGDNSGVWLRARLRDAAGRSFLADLTSSVNWSGRWRMLTATLPEAVEWPVVLEAIYAAEIHDDHKPSGELFLDDVAAAPAAENAPRKQEARVDTPSYVVRKTSEPIAIDGKLTESVWSRAVTLGDFALASGKGSPKLPTEVRVCWDDTNLYLAFVAIDTDIWGTMTNRDDPIYDEEVVEAFFSAGGDLERYYEFEFSPRNTVFDAKIQYAANTKSITGDDKWNCKGLKSAVTVVGTLNNRTDVDKRWTVEVALPFAEIGRKGRPPVEGESWRANFYRIDRAGEGEFSCWSSTFTDPPSFHIPARFGTLIFSTQVI